MEGITILFPKWLKNVTIVEQYGKITSQCIIITSERKAHIKEKHSDDYEFINSHIEETLLNPDIILEDRKNAATILVIKRLSNSGLNVVVRLQMSPNQGKYENSVITAYRVGEVSICKLIKKNDILLNPE
ncbi:MAG: hypothetical protein K5836_05350 [Clostridiales bacterium]|nr:hypothetical protein [Clostridiales bacterium]